MTEDLDQQLQKAESHLDEEEDEQPKTFMQKMRVTGQEFKIEEFQDFLRSAKNQEEQSHSMN